jgi:hypothetical protein
MTRMMRGGTGRTTGSASPGRQSETMTKATVTLTGALSPRGGWEAEHCPIASAVELVGNRSAFLFMREAFYGPGTGHPRWW